MPVKPRPTEASDLPADPAASAGGTGDGLPAVSLLPRFHRLPPDKQKRILSAAENEFTEHGFAGASLNRIIERAGISKGAMYYYFHDKAHLYLAILAEAVEKLLRTAPPLDLANLSRAGFWAELERYGHEIFAHCSRRPELVRLLRTARSANQGRGAPSLDDLREVGKDWARGIFERGQELGAVRRDVPMELMLSLWASLDSVADAWLLEHWDELDEAERAAHVTLLVDLGRRMWSP